MTAILGISAFYHDSAAALLLDGEIVAAAQEERFTRNKHDARFPHRAIEYCLSEADIKVKDLDYVGFYDKPLLKFERLLETYLSYAPHGFPSFLKAIPLWLKQKLHIPRILDKEFKKAYTNRYIFLEHHESHASSAFFPSPFEEAAILTVDGVGEWATASAGYGRNNTITLTHQLNFPHSLGLLYSAFTYFCGFKVNSGEYKLMGLAPYGQPVFADVILKELMDLKEDGSFRLNLSYFNYCQGLTMTSKKFHELFGGNPRVPDSPITNREMDIAASIQHVTNEIMLRMARYVHSKTDLRNLVLAGGVALNCVANGHILREGPFEDIWIQPAAGDAGGALGVALFIWHQLLENKRSIRKSDTQNGSLLGPSYGNDQIEKFLEINNIDNRFFQGEDDLCNYVADEITRGKIVGWFQGRMEFGPRALGSRSILGDGRNPQTQSEINQKVKFRESFRPLAPSVLAEHANEYFDIQNMQDSPYMLFVVPVHPEKRLEVNDAHVHGLEKLKIPRSVLPSITHVDYSARIQTVDAKRHGLYYKLLKTFKNKTGCPTIVNTSFNVRGEPIVCNIEHAYHCFMRTNIDVLVLGHYVLRKNEDGLLKSPTKISIETE